MRAGLHMKVPGSIENLVGSRLWLLPSMIRLMKRRGMTSVVSDFCVWGTAWRKPTRITAVC